MIPFSWNPPLEEVAVVRPMGRGEWGEEGGGSEASVPGEGLLRGHSQQGQSRPSLASGLQPGGNSETSPEGCRGLLALLPSLS